MPKKPTATPKTRPYKRGSKASGGKPGPEVNPVLVLAEWSEKELQSIGRALGLFDDSDTPNLARASYFFCRHLFALQRLIEREKNPSGRRKSTSAPRQKGPLIQVVRADLD